MNLNSRSSTDNQKNYQKMQSGKLADAIYRNNTTFRKQLETELQKLEIDTIKAQRNLELTQIAFRNKIRSQKQEWHHQQEKNFKKMYHYVYTKKDEIDNEVNLSARKSARKTNINLRATNDSKFIIKDYDEFISDEDDEHVMIEGNYEINKKPILVLMKTKTETQPQPQIETSSSQPVQKTEDSNLNLEKEKPAIKLSHSNTVINVSSKPTNYSQLIKTANNRLIESNNSLKFSSINTFFVPVKASNLQINIQDSPMFQSNSTNSLKVQKQQIQQKFSQSSLSFNTNTNKKEPHIITQISPLGLQFNKLDKVGPKTSSPALTKLAGLVKDLKVEGIRTDSNINSKHFQVKIENKDTVLKNNELIDIKLYKSPTILLGNRIQPLKIAHNNINEVEMKPLSTVINKQKFENRLKPFLKTNIEIQKQQVQHMQAQHERKLKTQVLDDERFTNLVSSLGTLGEV